MSNNQNLAKTTKAGLNVPAVFQRGDQLLISAKEIFNIAETFPGPFNAWFDNAVINNPLTLANDDYIQNESDMNDYFVSMDLAKRILMVSQSDLAYKTMIELQKVDIQHELELRA